MSESQHKPQPAPPKQKPSQKPMKELVDTAKPVTVRKKRH